ncbi:hypothetical protein HUG10_20730 (plasmid) [Halorarum halophilum]|uniref:N-acetyltransferase domain-containing protein n=1 Tax=Halorarum halophilum TaxID=2743090 RepID=A0A7D5KAN9_9EURY|nr:hypothetical protein [Halobaculum halophilum]QLG30034.1 hypothetical protein HUG10_20730 [Halobaculum halophilum]
MPRQLYTASGHADSCDCPIHRDGTAPTVPLGIEFADRVTITEIDRETALGVYQAHHSYCKDVAQTNIAHHGIEFDGHLVGAVTWRQPLLNELRLWTLPGGGLTRNSELGVDTFKISGGQIAEANRICIGVPTRNLASCGFAKSMDRFVDEHVGRLDLEWLLTFIRVDHVGSMLRALLDRDWELVGISEPKEPGNRPTREIHSWAKHRWLCPLIDYQSKFQSHQAPLVRADGGL